MKFTLPVFLLFLVKSVYACSCAPSFGPVPIRLYNETDVIFIGVAKTVSMNQSDDSFQRQEVEFTVAESFKGLTTEKSLRVFTPYGDASCGLNIIEGEKWIIWGSRSDDRVLSHLCTRSSPFLRVKKSDLDLLRSFSSNTSGTWFSNGMKVAEGKLINNLPVGKWIYYYNNGFPEEAGTFAGAKKHGKWIAYLNPTELLKLLKADTLSIDSTVSLESLANKPLEISLFRNGIRHGEFIRFSYWSGEKPVSVSNFLNGRQHGKQIGYYRDGTPYYFQNFVNGKIDGIERIYYRSGQLREEGTYENGKTSGEFKAYYEDGRLAGSAMGKRPFYNERTKTFEFK